MKKFYSYVYLDKNIIDDLYPQVFDDDITEKSITNSNEDITNMNINANLFNILGSEAKNSENNIFSENVKIVTSTARKAQLLINYFKTDTMYIQEIILENQPFDESIFFVGRSTFFLRDIYNKNTGESLFPDDMIMLFNRSNPPRIELNNDSILILETGDDEYVRRYKKYGCMDFNPYTLEIMMHLSNIKIRKDVRHLTSVIRKRTSFDFYVFGELIHTNENFYKISPFAMWQ